MRVWFSTNLILALFAAFVFVLGSADTDNAKNTEAGESSETGGKRGLRLYPRPRATKNWWFIRAECKITRSHL